jgi:hypothetical protein
MDRQRAQREKILSTILTMLIATSEVSIQE